MTTRMIRSGLVAMVCAIAITAPQVADAKGTSIGTMSFPLANPPLPATALLSFSFEMKTLYADSGGGTVTGKPVFSPIVITRSPDALSPLLLVAAASGRHFDRIVLVLTNAGDPVTYTLENVIFSSFAQSGGADVTETVSISYETITVSAGGATGGWNTGTGAQL